WLLLLVPLLARSQQAVPSRPSPLNIAKMRYKDAYVKLVYSQPHKRNRKVFGELVPYGQVWRTGANEATELTTTKDILINNQLLKAGTYSVFSIPQTDKWTIIINSELGLWGAYNHNPKLDVMRFDVSVHKQPNSPYEAFTMQFDQKNETADLLLMWDDVKVIVPFKFIN
ncbi:MAG TPA: DUF2911 domain-containing protein, partial [Chryseosolibacter sp.]|nr:DUF2911 domain-containing protein [Chryseosolibacter sp.]